MAFFGNDPFFQSVEPPLMLTHGVPRGSHEQQHPSMALSPFGGHMMMPFGGHSLFGGGHSPFGMSGHNPFGMMNGMMHRAMRDMEQQTQSGQCYSSSTTTVMQYSGAGGNPQVYHASTSTRQGPGGVKETRKAVKDSRTGEQKMAVGHQIGERSHLIERRFNAKSGDREEKQEFVNLDETDADSFSHEWREKTQPLNQTHVPSQSDRSRRHQFSNTRGLPSSSASTHPHISEVGSSSHQSAAQEHSRPAGGHVGKRKQRTPSLSREEREEASGGFQPVDDRRSHKHVRITSQPYVASWAASSSQDPSHSKPHSHRSERPSKPAANSK